MTGYLQRLLDTALPASGPPALTPVVKSTSPIFEQNQLLGLADFSAGEGEPEAALPPAAEALSATTASAPPLHPAATGPGVAMAEMTPFASRAAPWPEATPGPPLSADPLPPHLADAAAPALPEPSLTVSEAAWPDPETSEPAPRRETEPPALREPAREIASAPASFEPALLPAEPARAAAESFPPVGPEARFRSDPEVRPAAPDAAVRDLPREVEPIEHADPPFLPRELAPRPRPEFDEGVADPHQPQPAPPEVGPSITIGRVTVELVPDPAPVARPAGTLRTAATASMIGPLGNRRARRRLFALSRL